MVTSATGSALSRCPAALAEAIRAATRRRAPWDQTAALAASALRHHLPSPGVLSASERAGLADSYAQHMLHAEPDGSFSVIAVVWRPGQVTPVHDHVTWCVSGVIAGTEQEEIFELRDAGLHGAGLRGGGLRGGERGRGERGGGGGGGHLVPIDTRRSGVGSVSGFAPPGDIHRVRNRGRETSISIHVYGADISRLGSSVRRVYDLPIATGSVR